MLHAHGPRKGCLHYVHVLGIINRTFTTLTHIVMLADILLFVAFLYLVQMVVFAIATLKAHYPVDRAFRPDVTIIVAARNEEEYVGQCVESLLHLTYPVELLEIIIVDDRSTDRTAEIVQTYARHNSHIKLISVKEGSGNLRGKANAIDHGVAASTGEILIFTDADCRVPPRWVEETIKYYARPSVGIVAGFTSLRSQTWFEAIQAIDWFVLFSVAAATIRLKYPLTAVGNNFSIRRSAYASVGGYAAIPFSVTEDYALFHAVTRKAHYQAVFPADITTLVTSEPCRSWKQLFRQKKRWFTGGREMDGKSFALFSVPYGLNVGLVLGPLFMPMDTVAWCWMIKAGADALLAGISIKPFGLWRLLRYFPLFELYYLAYVTVFPLIVLPGTDIVWKERTISNQQKQKRPS